MITRMVHNVFTLDLRSLALFRIGLGMVILHNIFSLLPNIHAFWGPQGLYPLTEFYSAGGFIPPSVYALSDNVCVTAGFLGIHVFGAVLLIMGHRTRQAAFLCWLLQVSLCNRMPMAFFGGDDALTIALLWGMFLPLGAYYSVDRAMAETQFIPTRVTSAAAAAIILHVVCIYVMAGWAKTSPYWTTEHTALFYIFSAQVWVKQAGTVLLGFPDLLNVMTQLTILLERYVIVLLMFPVCTGWWRGLLAAIFSVFHLGIFLTMHAGAFAFIMFAYWAALIPSGVWEWAGRRANAPRFNAVRRIYYDGPCTFCRKTAWLLKTFLILRPVEVVSAATDPAIQHIIDAKKSWVVEFADGRRVFAFQGIIAVIGASPVFFYIKPLLQLPPVSRMGEALYAWIAGNRRIMGSLTKPMVLRPYRVLNGPAGRAAAAGCLVLTGVLYGYILFMPDARMAPAAMTGGTSLHLTRGWNMFSAGPMPYKRHYEYRPVFSTPYTDRDTREFEMFAASFRLTGQTDYRWIMILDSMTRQDKNWFAGAVPAYMVRTWNRAHPAGPHLKDIIFNCRFELIKV